MHFFGTATLSVADNIKTQPGDRFEVSMREFGEPLCNTIEVVAPAFSTGEVQTL